MYKKSRMGTKIRLTFAQNSIFSGDDGKISYRSGVDVFAAGLVYLAMLQATEGSTLRPSAEESVGDSTEGGKHIGLVMYMRSNMNHRPLNVTVLRPGDSSTIRKVKKMISNMTSFDPNERPKAADVDRLLKAIVTLVSIDSTMSRYYILTLLHHFLNSICSYNEHIPFHMKSRTLIA